MKKLDLTIVKSPDIVKWLKHLPNDGYVTLQGDWLVFVPNRLTTSKVIELKGAA